MNESERFRERMAEYDARDRRAVVRAVSLGLAALLIVVAVGWANGAFGAEETPPCSANLPQPPLLVVLPDGTEIPATRIDYDLAARRIVVVGNPRTFCDGFED